MLASDVKKLWWLGIDMQPRWRRRAAVVVTYCILFVLVMVAMDNYWAPHRYLALAAMVLSTVACQSASVFRRNGVLKSFEDPRPVVRGRVMVNGLDEWARYRFGAANFEEATEKQQTELLRRYRVGTFLVPAKAKPWVGLDEREIGERDNSSRWALQRIATLLAMYAGIFAVKPKPLEQMEMAGFLWSFFLLAITLPQARILWTEPDPREDEEMRLVMAERELG